MLQNTIYFRYRLIKVYHQPMESLIFAFLADPDLVFFSEDLLCFDITLQLGTIRPARFPVGRSRSRLHLMVHKILDQQVRPLFSDVSNRGTYQVTWEGQNPAGQRVSSGMYLVRLLAEPVTDEQRRHTSLVQNLLLIRRPACGEKALGFFQNGPSGIASAGTRAVFRWQYRTPYTPSSNPMASPAITSVR